MFHGSQPCKLYNEYIVKYNQGTPAKKHGKFSTMEASQGSRLTAESEALIYVVNSDPTSLVLERLGKGIQHHQRNAWEQG